MLEDNILLNVKKFGAARCPFLVSFKLANEMFMVFTEFLFLEVIFIIIIFSSRMFS